jgi:uncharacterized metal-binding protein
MADESKCCCGDVTIVMACSGGSNVGQITNEVGKMLDKQGVATLFCLAGIGGGIQGMVASAEGADKVLVIDGCQVKCAKECMDKAGIAGYEYLVVTDLGIKKEHTFDLESADIDCVMKASLEKLHLQK